MRKIKLFLFAVAMFTACGVANASKPEEPIIGTKHIGFSLDEPTIDLGSSFDALSFDGLEARRPAHRSSGGSGKRSIGGELDYNFMRLGLGVKYGYQFTDVCRFVVQADYYIMSSRYVNSGGPATIFWGRQFDISPAVNFVFGNGNFHFYLVTGLSFGWGYNELLNILSDTGSYLSNGEAAVSDENGNGRYDRSELVGNLSVGFRLGCGVEYQISDYYRIFWEQALDLVFPISSINWMPRLGVSYCF